MRNTVTTTTSGFFSAAGRVLQHALDPKRFLHNVLFAGGAVCSAQLLHFVATTIGGSLGYLTSCLVGSKNSDTTNAVVGWVILAALLAHIAKKGYRTYSAVVLMQRAMLEMEKSCRCHHPNNITTTETDSRNMKTVLPGLAGVFAAPKKSDSTEVLADQLVREQRESDAKLQALVDEVLREQQATPSKSLS